VENDVNGVLMSQASRRYRIAQVAGRFLASSLLAAGSNGAIAAGVPTASLDEIVVVASLTELQGDPGSASQGIVTEDQLELRPVLRTGELLETVPGLVVTQHSGAGKANQYFLRGFNLDHGTDFATSVDGVPVNMPTHAHGQGYTDINFVIPEFLQSIEYRKGTYYAESGNFSAAGAANMNYRKKLDESFVALEGGERRYHRGVLGLSPQIGAGHLLIGLELSTNDGPWVLAQEFEKTNGLLKYTSEWDGNAFGISAQLYEGDWVATDQIPLRGVRTGALDRFGFVDPSNGGDTHRYSIAADWSGSLSDHALHAHLYVVDYELDLFSNFTYFIDPVNGDQFEQFDDRRIYGGEFAATRSFKWMGLGQTLNYGVQWRRDDIDKVGLYLTTARERRDIVREDSVVQSSYSAYLSADLRFNERIRSSVGLRADKYVFDVDSDHASNSGSADDSLLSPKLSMVFGPWKQTELFLNVGRGFHSNDARGTTITVDPADDVTPVDRVNPLVRALGYDIGLRTAALDSAQLSVAVFKLELDSELVYIGDAGATEASGASKRRGVEVGIVYNSIPWLIIDADGAYSHARFENGDRIPNAVESVLSMGVIVNHPSGYIGGLRFRHFGSAPLIEDNSARSSSTTVVNLEAGYASKNGWKASLGLYNVFDSDDNDITYFYGSQLANEAAPIDDIHFHPVEPRTIRASLSFAF
jgi:hypothetical protein